MQWQRALPYSIPLVSITIILLVLSMYVWRYRAVAGSRSLLLLACGAAEWALGYALEISTTGSAIALIFARLQYLGIMTIPVAWLSFALAYGGHTHRLSRSSLALLSIIPIVTNLLVWTNDLHGWVWPRITIDDAGFIPILRFEHGLAFWVCNIYALVLLLLGSFILIRSFLQSPRLYLHQLAALVIAVLGPWLGNIVYTTHLIPASSLDLTPFAFFITILAVTFGIWRYRFLKVVPQARGYLFEHLLESIVVLDDRNQIIDWNESARSFLGTTNKQIGLPANQLLAPWPVLQQAVDAPIESQLELKVTEQSGEARIYSIDISPLYAEQQPSEGRIIIWRDVTSQRNVEDVLREQNRTLRELQGDLIRARDAAEQASRAKSSFVASMSHELRTPLTAILGYAELMLLQLTLQPDTDLRQDIQAIATSGAHLLDLINSILDLAKIESGKLDLHCESIQLDAMVSNIVLTVQPLVARNRNTLIVTMDSEIGVMLSDEVKVRRILLNLLSNAAKFTEQGQINLRIFSSEALQPNALADSLLGGNDWLTFEVSDTGIGISVEQLQALFTPFSQAGSLPNRLHEGTGLGLYLSRRLCQLMGGDLTVQSEVGGGSIFRATLPRNTTVADSSHVELSLADPELRYTPTQSG